MNLFRYYDHLVFTIDQELPTESICNLMNTVNDDDDAIDASQQVLESDNIEILDEVNKKITYFLTIVSVKYNLCTISRYILLNVIP